MPKKDIPRVQHYVPQFILKHFTDGKKPQVWVYDKSEGRKFRSNVSNVAAESGFYDFEFKGAELSLEPALSSLESDASRVIKQIIKQESLADFSREEKALLSSFIAVQFVRTKQNRMMSKAVVCDLEERIRQMGFEPERIKGFAKFNEQEEKMLSVMCVQRANEYVPHFMEKDWVLLKGSKRNPLLISDNPITLQNHNDFSPYGNIGLSVKGIQIHFPISKELSLGLYCPSIGDQVREGYEKYLRLAKLEPTLAAGLIKDPLGLAQLAAGFNSGRAVPLKPENVLNLNSLQVRFSERFLFSSINDFTLPELMITEHPEYKLGPRMHIS